VVAVRLEEDDDGAADDECVGPLGNDAEEEEAEVDGGAMGLGIDSGGDIDRI
jgi:hypothetical protein